MQDLEEVLIENNTLREQLEVSKRQFHAIIDRNKENIDFIEGNDKRPTHIRVESQSSKPGADGLSTYTKQADMDPAGIASNEEILDLKKRCHLLSEENQVLFQQTSFLRA